MPKANLLTRDLYTVLEEHNADRLVWVEPFEDTASEKHSVVYIR